MRARKEKAISYLERYHKIGDRVKLIGEQMFETERVLQALRSCLPEEGRDPALEEMLAAGQKKQKELALRRTALLAQRNLIGEVVARLPFPERRVIERFFLEGTNRKASDDLMEELEFEKTQIYRLRERGLDRVAELIEGPETVFWFTADGELTAWESSLLPTAPRASLPESSEP